MCEPINVHEMHLQFVTDRTTRRHRCDDCPQARSRTPRTARWDRGRGPSRRDPTNRTSRRGQARTVGQRCCRTPGPRGASAATGAPPLAGPPGSRPRGRRRPRTRPRQLPRRLTGGRGRSRPVVVGPHGRRCRSSHRRGTRRPARERCRPRRRAPRQRGPRRRTSAGADRPRTCIADRHHPDRGRGPRGSPRPPSAHRPTGELRHRPPRARHDALDAWHGNTTGPLRSRCARGAGVAPGHSGGTALGARPLHPARGRQCCGAVRGARRHRARTRRRPRGTGGHRRPARAPSRRSRAHGPRRS